MAVSFAPKIAEFLGEYASFDTDFRALFSIFISPSECLNTYTHHNTRQQQCNVFVSHLHFFKCLTVICSCFSFFSAITPSLFPFPSFGTTGIYSYIKWLLNHTQCHGFLLQFGTLATKCPNLMQTSYKLTMYYHIWERIYIFFTLST